MTIQQLQYFLTVCEELNYSRAAERLYLSRQALRQSISALEKELCGPLFANTRNHLSLTEKGQRLRDQAAPVVEQFGQMCRAVYAEIAPAAPIRLGISVALVPDYLPSLYEYLELFRHIYPGIALEPVMLANDLVADRLEQGTLEAGLVLDLGTAADGLTRTGLTSHPAAVLVSRDCPFWEARSVPLSALAGQRLLVPGLRPDALAPLWAGFRAAGCAPDVSVGEQFYQANYQVQEMGYICINRDEPYPRRTTDLVRDIRLEGVPPICAAFLQPAGSTTPCAELLRDFLRQRLQQRL